jgi:hypothetical protein
VRRKKARVELLAYLHRLLAGEAIARGEVGDRFEVVVLSTRQGPIKHARRRITLLFLVKNTAFLSDQSWVDPYTANCS